MFTTHPIRRPFFSIGLILSVFLLVAPAWSGKPDLQIQFLDKGPTVPNPPLTDRPTSFNALVVNTGNQNIKGPFIVTFVLDGTVAKTWQFPIKNEIKDYKPGAQSAIPPGKGRLYQYAATLKPGKHTLLWNVNAAKESELKATVEAQLPPDLVVNIWPTGYNVLAYKETEWNVEVKNIGGGKASGPFVTLFKSVPSSGPVPLLEFPKGQSLDKDETYIFKVNQVYNSLEPVTVSAIVDYHGDVTEALPFGHDNNNFEKKYVPQYVDLEVTALEIKPAQLTTAPVPEVTLAKRPPSASVEVSCTVQNKGNMDAGKPFNVGILVKEVSSGAIRLIDAVEAAPLPAGESEKLTKKINLSQPGTYTAQVIADAAMIGPDPNVIGRQYSEPNEANNAKEEQFTVSPTAAPAPAAMPPEESPDQTGGGPLARVTDQGVTGQRATSGFGSGCKPGKGIVKLYRIASECSTGSVQPYTGFIPAIKNGSLRRVTNATTQWKVKIVDSFNHKGSGGSASNDQRVTSGLKGTAGDASNDQRVTSGLKGTGGDAQCEKFGGLCWDRIPLAFLAPGESWVNTAVSGLNAGKSINACLEPLTNDPFPLDIEIEYEYECLQ